MFGFITHASVKGYKTTICVSLYTSLITVCHAFFLFSYKSTKVFKIEKKKNQTHEQSQLVEYKAKHNKWYW